MKKGNNKEAEKLLSEAFDIEEVGLHQNHPNKISSQNFLISLYLHLSQLLFFCFLFSALILWSECLLNIADYKRAQPALFSALRIININQQPSNSSQTSKGLIFEWKVNVVIIEFVLQ